MKLLKNSVILYDGACPMCSLYTGAFIKAGMLDRNGRVPYQHLPEDLRPYADMQRAVNEIALVNRDTGEVHYGIKSLFAVLGHAMPWLRPLFRLRPFAWLMNKLYKLISYNRRVIMPATSYVPPQHNPSFNRAYRIAYLAIAWLLTAFVLHRYSIRLQGLVPAGSFYRELAMCGGQLAWQSVFIRSINSNRRREYLGNMMTVSLGGALLLLVCLLPALLFPAVPALYYAGCFLLTVLLMCVEHMRRVRLLGLRWWLTATWILYRALLLIFLFQS